MQERVFSKTLWREALDEMRTRYRVFVPTRQGDVSLFAELEPDTRCDFVTTNTLEPPKRLVYPQSERLLEFSTAPEGAILAEVPKAYPPQLVVGLRPCDAHAFEITRVNFDTPDFRDPWWVRRIQSTTFVGVACTDPCDTCFCHAVGGSPSGTRGLDAIVHDLGDAYLARSLTRRGDEWLAGIRQGRKVTQAERQQADALAEAAVAGMGPVPDFVAAARHAVLALFDASWWEDVAFGCLSCGVCTFLCPTCWCFDIQDEAVRGGGERIRNWDSCMFPLFTLHASGHNPRADKMARVRQRFMHKLKYYVDRYGNGVQCSGCGRCVRHCPVNIDIRRVAQRMIAYQTPADAVA